MVPPIMAGRESILDSMARAFDEGIDNPNLSTILIGARGTGKTALLSCISEGAQEHGWVAANVAATDRMLMKNFGFRNTVAARISQ